MGARPSRSGARALRTALGALALGLAIASSAAAVTGPSGNHGATITASFSDGCRDFAAQSSKSFAYVKVRYADGRVVKDEKLQRPTYAIDGAAGDELDSVFVKSGTTWESFTCPRTSVPPTAVLELRTPQLANCMFFPWPEYPTCLASQPRTVWSRPPGGSLAFLFVAPFPPTRVSFRGTTSTDPDDDIESWSIDFGDGTSTGGGWATEPPAEIEHTYAAPFFGPGFPTVSLTVTDAAGQSDSDALTLIGIDATPD